MARSPKKEKMADDLKLLIINDAGRSSSEYARTLGVNKSDVNKVLREMARRGIVYSVPMPGVHAHQWFLNAMNRNGNKAKIVSRLWNKNINLLSKETTT